MKECKYLQEKDYVSIAPELIILLSTEAKLNDRNATKGNIDIKGTSGEFAMSVEVTKVNKAELLFIDNARYHQMIEQNPHLKVLPWKTLTRKSGFR
jgi:hypothetical protein